MIPTVICGRWNRFSSLYPETIQLRKVRNNFDTGLASQEELTVAQNSVVQLLLRRLEACQVTITTSGGIRWDSIYDVTRRIAGCRNELFTKLTRIPGTNQFHRQPVVSLPLSWTESLHEDDFSFAKQYTHLPLCFSLPGPFSTAIQTQNASAFGVQRVAEHFADVFNQELKYLLPHKEMAFVMIEEPHLFNHPQEFLQFQALMARLTDGIDQTKLALSGEGHRDGWRQYFELPFDIFRLNFVQKENSWTVLRNFPADKRLIAGVVDAKSTYRESPREIRGLIKDILGHVSPDALTVAGNADWHFLPWDRALDKIKSLVEAADHV